MKHIRTHFSDLKTLSLTFIIALCAGFLCHLIGLPAPYMLGSLFGVWLFGGIFKSLCANLGVARWFHKPVVILLATLIGGTFNQEILSKAVDWLPTLIVMFVATVAATSVGLFYMIWVRKHPKELGTLCCLPGGQAEILLIAKEYTDKDYVVALCHLVRVVFVFLSTPAILAFVSGSQGVQQSYITQAALPSLFDLTWINLVLFIGTGLLGFGFANLFKVPIPHLLGPLIFSALLHLIGLIEIPRIGEFVILAQLTIAGAIGARLSRVPFKELASYLVDAIVNATLIVSTFIGFAFVISLVSDMDFIRLLLAFIPGGLYEVTLLALIFGFDVAFVAFHHTIRILMIFFTLPFLLRNIRT